MVNQLIVELNATIALLAAAGLYPKGIEAMATVIVNLEAANINIARGSSLLTNAAKVLEKHRLKTVKDDDGNTPW